MRANATIYNSFNTCYMHAGNSEVGKVQTNYFNKFNILYHSLNWNKQEDKLKKQELLTIIKSKMYCLTTGTVQENKQTNQKNGHKNELAFYDSRVWYHEHRIGYSSNEQQDAKNKILSIGPKLLLMISDSMSHSSLLDCEKHVVFLGFTWIQWWQVFMAEKKSN